MPRRKQSGPQRPPAVSAGQRCGWAPPGAAGPGGQRCRGAAGGAGQQPSGRAGARAASEYHNNTYNEREGDTVKVLSPLILPADEQSSGASQAGVPEFTDDWLNFKGGKLKAEILGGLTWLDMETNRAFKYDFAECARSQQTQILDRIAYPQKAAPEDASAVEFFNLLRDLVLSGFFTSQAGISDLPYLGNEPLSDWKGCPAPALAKLGLDTGEGKA